jgi:hypothetical protein
MLVLKCLVSSMLNFFVCVCVCRFVLSLENDLTVRSKTSEVAVKDFSSGSYATIFREEVNIYYILGDISLIIFTL